MHALNSVTVCILAFFIVPQLAYSQQQPGPFEPVALAPDSSVTFASREQGVEVLSRRDEYILRMSRFDRMLRMNSTNAVSESTYVEYVAVNVRDWNSTETARLKPIVEQLHDATSELNLPLPQSVILVKTTGEAEVGQAHTRSNAIVLPLRSLGLDDETLLFLLAHELFHVMSRHDALFREATYRQIGFRIGNEISLPELIAPLQITNPDAPRHDSFIELTSNGRKLAAVPVLLSRSAVFDPQIGTALDHFWTLRFLVVARSSNRGEIRAVRRNGAPVLLRLHQIEDFLDQVGTNTRYIIHPEEIVAENFALMVTGAEVNEPNRIEALRGLLQSQPEN